MESCGRHGYALPNSCFKEGLSDCPLATSVDSMWPSAISSFMLASVAESQLPQSHVPVAAHILKVKRGVTESSGAIKVLSFQQGMSHPNKAIHTLELPTILAEVLSVLYCILISSFANPPSSIHTS